MSIDGVLVTLVAAVADNGVIGRDNDLPWHLPGDLAHFKRVTQGKPVIMGRRTWESIEGPLPRRTNIVVTRRSDYLAEGAEVVATVEAALEMAAAVARRDGVDEVMVVGGSEIYRLALPAADRLCLTEVHAEVTGDTFFPEWDRDGWREVSREQFPAGESGQYDFSIAVYERP